jgi:hypothetical protein
MGTRPEGPEIGAKLPVAETVLFPLDLGSVFGGKSILRQIEIPPVLTGITARHWRALLFVGFAFSVLARRDAATAPRITAKCESFSDSCRGNFP